MIASPLTRCIAHLLSGDVFVRPHRETELQVPDRAPAAANLEDVDRLNPPRRGPFGVRGFSTVDYLRPRPK